MNQTDSGMSLNIMDRHDHNNDAFQPRYACCRSLLPGLHAQSAIVDSKMINANAICWCTDQHHPWHPMSHARQMQLLLVKYVVEQ